MRWGLVARKNRLDEGVQWNEFERLLLQLKDPLLE